MNPNESIPFWTELVTANLGGGGGGVCSICSSNRFVLEAAMQQAHDDDSNVCIESTANQVNQFGGYSGMTPDDFAAQVRALALEQGMRIDRVVLGGDHLGPYVWRREPAESAMAKARRLIADCVRAGYSKIHLDASMHLGGDPGDVDAPPDEAVVTERMVELCAAAEEAFAELPAGAPSPIYVIGTEVPVPGGELLDRKGPVATRAADAERTLRLSRDALCRKGLQPAWNRVAALVVQPGVEFADDLVFEYDCAQARALSSFIENGWDVVFEAHSTDYQQPAALRRLVQDHFAILKVGPWLTFALREALFALARMEEEWLEGKGATLSHLPQVLDQAMLQDPRDWAAYYRGDERDLRYSRKYSYSDRSRYYWPRPAVQAAVELLLHNLSQRPAPLTLLSQFMSNQYLAVREGRIANHPRDWIHDKIREVLRVYADACSARRTG